MRDQSGKLDRSRRLCFHRTVT